MQADAVVVLDYPSICGRAVSRQREVRCGCCPASVFSRSLRRTVGLQTGDGYAQGLKLAAWAKIGVSFGHGPSRCRIFNCLPGSEAQMRF